jgi:methionine-rich copper-binding protein CopC
VVSSEPVDRSALVEAPDEIDLVGSAVPDPSLSHVTVWASGGATVGPGTLTASGRILRQSVDITANGDYTVAYHIVFTDGSDTIGVVRFSVGTGVPPPVPPESVRESDLQVAQQHEHGIDPLNGVLLVADLVVLLVLGYLLLSKAKPRRPGPARPAAEGKDPRT